MKVHLIVESVVRREIEVELSDAADFIKSYESDGIDGDHWDWLQDAKDQYQKSVLYIAVNGTEQEVGGP